MNYKNKLYNDHDNKELDEAINHLNDMLSDQDHEWSCEECRKDHTNLMRWLMELREFRKLSESVSFILSFVPAILIILVTLYFVGK